MRNPQTWLEPAEPGGDRLGTLAEARDTGQRGDRPGAQILDGTADFGGPWRRAGVARPAAENMR